MPRERVPSGWPAPPTTGGGSVAEEMVEAFFGLLWAMRVEVLTLAVPVGA
jgi:hypothetical protein